MVIKEKYESTIHALYRRNEKFLFISAAIFFTSLFLGYFLSGVFDFFLKSIFDEFKRSIQNGRIKLTTLSIFTHNLQTIFLIYGGGFLLGAFTILFLFINGSFLGYVMTKGPIGNMILLILPHGIFEIIGLIIAGAAGFRLASFTYRFVNNMLSQTWYGSIFSKIKHIFNENRDEFQESLMLLGISIVFLFIAAIIEANFTLGLYQYLTGL
ncbi:stage II sporulation protein M [Methanobacterium alcaliphilum]|uniref:stage II sporulation protein M n=1 Tax=Methanobacterium alcaliphilum TaxID=392018 RepID=UPI002009E53D|nr:stage II sporulation protein M [Methanobacterium alcaliphilum]MCK9151749.1 stage II sporulation protein M [Methanobacterium alcaliphilum]